MGPHLRNHLIGQICPYIEHGHENARELEVAVDPSLLNLLLHAEDFSQPLHGKIFALQGNDQIVGCRQRVQGKHG